jgi:hypothetical protein
MIKNMTRGVHGLIILAVWLSAAEAYVCDGQEVGVFTVLDVFEDQVFASFLFIGGYRLFAIGHQSFFLFFRVAKKAGEYVHVIDYY